MHDDNGNNKNEVLLTIIIIIKKKVNTGKGPFQSSNLRKAEKEMISEKLIPF